MLVRFWMMVDHNFIPLKPSFLEHIRQKILVNIVVQILDRDFDVRRLPDVVLINRQSTKTLNWLDCAYTIMKIFGETSELASRVNRVAWIKLLRDYEDPERQPC